MPLQTDHAIASDQRVMQGAFWQIQPVTGEEGQISFEGGQAEGDRPADHVDDLVVAVRVGGIHVKGAV